MKDYSKSIFLGLNQNRQFKVTLDLIGLIEVAWESKTKVEIEPLVEKLKAYLLWLSETESGERIKSKSLSLSLEKDVSLRKVLNVAIALERELSLSMRDDDIVIAKTDDPYKKKSSFPLYVVLDNLRSAFNIGSVFRTAECLGVSHIYLVGYTATPEHDAVKKTAMGTEELVPWTAVNNIEDVIKDLKSKNIKLAALETSNVSTDLFETKTKQELALFLGNERFGLEPKVLKEMDMVLEIPMRGQKNSLNVSNAFAIAVSEILRSWRV